MKVFIFAIFGLCLAVLPIQGKVSETVFGIKSEKLENVDWKYWIKHLRVYRNHAKEISSASCFLAFLVYPRQVYNPGWYKLCIQKGSGSNGKSHFYKYLYENLVPLHGRTWIDSYQDMLLISDFCTGIINQKDEKRDQELKKLQKRNWMYALEFYNEFTKNEEENDDIIYFPYLIATYFKKIQEDNLEAPSDLIGQIMRLDYVAYDYVFENFNEKNCSSIREVLDRTQKRQAEKILKELKTLGLEIGCVASSSRLEEVIDKVMPTESLFFNKATRTTFGKMSRFHFEMDRIKDLLAAGCGDLHLNPSSILAMFSQIINSRSRFTRLVSQMNTTADTSNVALDNNAFSTFTSTHKAYEDLGLVEREQLQEHLRVNRLYAPLEFLKKMPYDSFQSLPTIVNKLSKCTSQKLADVLSVVNIWTKDIVTPEASNQLKALFEASKCDMLYQLGTDKQKEAVRQIVKILEVSFGLVSCYSSEKAQTYSSVSSASVETLEFINNLKKNAIDPVIITSVDNITDTLLKESRLLSEGCLRLGKQNKDLFRIMSSLPQSFHFETYNRTWSNLSESVERSFQVYQEYDKLTPTEQTQLMEKLSANGTEQKNLEKLVASRHKLLDLKLAFTHLAACPQMGAFMEIIELWNKKVTTPEDRERVIRMLEVSDCAMVDNVAPEVKQLVRLLDEHFATRSCIVEMGEEDKWTRVFPNRH